VYIRSKLGWEKERKIKIEGQFNYPGTYVLFEEETLGDLIERAGGFKNNAYVDAAVLTRKSVKELEEQRIREYSMQLENDILQISSQMAYKDNSQEAQAILEQQLALKKNLLDLKTLGRVVIDLTNKENYRNFTLEDGDSLYVPRKIKTVSVIGEVYNPATFQFDESEKTVSHFIEAAGGVKNTADIRHIYIIKANGSIITNKKKRVIRATLEPGDAVVVPQKIKYTNPHKLFVDTVDAVFKIASLLGTIVALMIAVDRINN
jgi:protein involved in polysaccharide export with SLBB domain